MKIFFPSFVIERKRKSKEKGSVALQRGSERLSVLYQEQKLKIVHIFYV